MQAFSRGRITWSKCSNDGKCEASACRRTAAGVGSSVPPHIYFVVLAWRSSGPLGSAKISNSTEVEVEGNIRELVRDNAAFRQAENSDGEIATSSLTTLLGRVSGNSTYEVDNLIGDLQNLRKKLQADGNRIRRDIEQYAQRKLSLIV
jgi:hypothetical protein